MSEPIKNKRIDLSAPTPQNTPSTAAPISSHAVQPSVSTIEEESRASIFAQHPQLVSMIQGRLNNLVGKSSGYVESLPEPVRRRITGLKGVQAEHAKLEAEFQEEVLKLEKAFFEKYRPLYEKRAKIINGAAEPTEEELALGKQAEEDAESDDEDAEPKEEKPEAPKAQEGDADIKGIPEFWLTALKNHVALAETITDRDEPALKHLIDIRLAYLDPPGFQLIFEFSENEFFTNKTITKTYYYQEHSGYGGDFIYDHAEGDKINWNPDKDLTVRIESKKQRNKNTKQTRVLKKTVPTESFFNFFNPPTPPGEDFEGTEEETNEIDSRLELDYHLGEDIKEKLIPHAIDWFTGEALQYEENFDELEGAFDEDDFSDEEPNLDEDDEEDTDDDDEDTTKPKQDTAECKQS